MMAKVVKDSEDGSLTVEFDDGTILPLPRALLTVAGDADSPGTGGGGGSVFAESPMDDQDFTQEEWIPWQPGQTAVDLNEETLAEAMAQIRKVGVGMVARSPTRLIVPAWIIEDLGGIDATREIVQKIMGFEIEDLPVDSDLSMITRDIARGG